MFKVLVLISIIFQTYSAYYSTLPKGVRNFTYRYIQSGDITGSFDDQGKFEGYNVKGNINAESLEGLDSSIDDILDLLTPEEYDEFSLGSFEGNAISNVKAHAFGGGYGVTNYLTIYGFITYYDASVDLNLIRTSEGQRNVEISNIGVEIENLPDVNERVVQSFFVNYLDYQPLGRWEARAFGDMELGVMYKLTNIKHMGLKLPAGVTIPTGREDDPDILQDISFGDGQWDAFFEFGGGYKKIGWVTLDSWVRYDHQFSMTKEVRLPESSDFPVTSRKGKTKINLGNKFSYNFQANKTLFEDYTISALYTFLYKEKDDYDSIYSEADIILEQDTSEKSHTMRINLGYSTLRAFKAKSFPAPLNINFAYQNTFAGKNTPEYSRFEAELRLFF